MNINLEGKGEGACRAAACLVRHMLANPGVQYRTRDAAACSAVLDALGLVAGDDYEMEESRVSPGVHTISWATGEQHVRTTGAVSEWSTPEQVLGSVGPVETSGPDGEPFNPYLHLAETTWARLGMKRGDSSPILPPLSEMERAVRELHGTLDGMSRGQLFASDTDDTGISVLVHSVRMGEDAISPDVFMHAPLGTQWRGNWSDGRSPLLGYFANTVPQGYEDPSETYLVLMESSVSGEGGAATDETIRFVHDWDNVRRHIETVMSKATGLVAIALPCTRLTSDYITMDDAEPPHGEVSEKLLELEGTYARSGRRCLAIRCAVVLGDRPADRHPRIFRPSAAINFKPTGPEADKADGAVEGEEKSGAAGLEMTVREQLTREWLAMTHLRAEPKPDMLRALTATGELSRFATNGALSSTCVGGGGPSSPDTAPSAFCSAIRSAIREASGGRMVKGSVENRRAEDANSVLVSLWSGMTTDMSPRFGPANDDPIETFPVPPEEGSARSTVTAFVRFLEENPSIQTAMSKRHVGTGRSNHIVIDTNISYGSVASDGAAMAKMRKRIEDSFEYAFCRNIIDPMAAFGDRSVEGTESFAPWTNDRGIDRWSIGDNLARLGGVTNEILTSGSNGVASIVPKKVFSYSSSTRNCIVIDRSKLGIKASLLESEDGNLVIVVTSPVSDTWANRLAFRMACGVKVVQENVRRTGPYFISDGSARETAEFARKMNSGAASMTAWMCLPRIDELYLRDSYSWDAWETDDEISLRTVNANTYRDWASMSASQIGYRELLSEIMG